MSLEIVNIIGDSNVANVYMAKTGKNGHIEFAESLHSIISQNDKWVLIISTLYGCPIGCIICDASNSFAGKLSKEEIFAQIDYLVNLRYPNGIIDCREFKVQFARMGEPALNPAVLEVLIEMPARYKCSGLLLPSFSTVAPIGCDDFLARLIEIKNSLYPDGKFQMQFSIHTTDAKLRDTIIPTRKWGFAKIADYGEKFYAAGDKKIGLNFALAKNFPLSVEELKKYFSPEIFLIKITPVNPTISSKNNNLESYFVGGDLAEDTDEIVAKLNEAGYEVILSIGDRKENKIGSNCGQYVRKYMEEKNDLVMEEGYSYIDKECHLE